MSEYGKVRSWHAEAQELTRDLESMGLSGALKNRDGVMEDDNLDPEDLTGYTLSDCPSCGMRLGTKTATPAVPGDFTICVACVTVLQYRTMVVEVGPLSVRALVLVPATEEALAAAPPVLRQAIAHAIRTFESHRGDE